MGMNVAAHADTTDTDAVNQQPATTQSVTNENGATSGSVADKSADTQSVNVADLGQSGSATELTDSKVPSPSSTINSVDYNTVAASATIAQPTQSQTVSDWSSFVSAMNDSNIGTIVLKDNIQVSANGMNQPNPIANPAKVQFKGQGIARKLVITSEAGQNYTINFNTSDNGYSYYWDFTNNNQSGNKAWDLIFRDVTINAKGEPSGIYAGGFAPIYFGDSLNTANATADTVTFDNVTANVENGSLIAGSMHNSTSDNADMTVVFTGTNTINNANVNVNGNGLYNYGSTIDAGRVVIADGTTTINTGTAKTNNDMNYGGNAIYANLGDTTDANGNVQGSVTIAPNATLSIKGQSNDVRGIQALNGTVQVNGTYNADMRAGHSTAILAANLNIAKYGSVTINTKQDNQADGTEAGWVNAASNYNGTHYAPISLGVGTPVAGGETSTAATATLNNEGSLTIIRDAGKTNTGLISMGNNGNGSGKTNTLNVQNGATLNLQDNAGLAGTGSFGTTGAMLGNYGYYTNTPKVGMITLWGSSAKDTINFNEPGYVNLQRTGNTVGTFIRNEGNGTFNLTGTVPVAQWDESNLSDTPSFAPWYINNMKVFNNWGDSAISGFAQAGNQGGTAAGVGTEKMLHSNGNVIMGANQAGKNSFKFDNGNTITGSPNYTNKGDYYQPYLNQFLNNFSLWKPQRLTFGEQNIPGNKQANIYAPEVQEIPGTTSQKLSDLTAKDGIKDLITADGNTVALPNDATVTWYNSATDKTDWNSKMLNSDGSAMPEPINPTGNLKTTDKSAWAKVTYGDGSVDFVNIPLRITDNNAPAVPSTKTDADQNDPRGQNVTTTVGTVPSAKDGVQWPSGQPEDVNGNSINLPDSAYTWAGGNPDVSKAGVVPAIVNITYPDGSQDQVAVNVIVKDASGNVPTTDPTKDNGKYDPEGKEVSTTIGTPVDPSTTITWPNGAPTDGTPTYEWSTKPDIWSQGQHPGVVKVTYADGTSDLVPVTVDVTDAPSGKNTTVSQNTPADHLPDPATVIEWKNADGTPVPAPTDPNITYTWTKNPDTTQPGATTGVVTITYPNGEKTPVVVPITVTPTNTTGAYTPYVDPQNYPYDPTGAGVPDDPTSLVKLPNGETAPANVHYEWGTKPDTTKPSSTQTATVSASYPDPNDSTKTITKTIPVIVHIGSMADKYDPKAHDLEVPFNADMSRYPASTQIFNVPTDVAHTDVWAPMPVTSVSGTQPTMIKVTYGDGSFDYVPLNVKVDEKLSDKYPVSYNGLNIPRPNDNSTASGSVDPTLANNTPAGAITGYEIPANFTAPANVTVHVDQTTGKVTATAVKNSKLGSFNVPVNVTYSDQLSNGQPDTVTVYVPVSITGEDHNGNYYGDQTMTQCKGSVPVLHKTTDSNSIDSNNASISKLQTITYNYDWDHTNGNGHYKSYKIFKLNAAGTGYYLAEVGTQDDADVHRVATNTYTEANTPTKFDDVNATWTWRNAAGQSFAPSTNVDAFGGNTGDTLYKNTDGSINEDEQTGPNDPTGLYGNSKWRMDYKIGNTNFLRAAGLPSFYGTTGTWTNTYFDFLGATAKSDLTAHVGADVPTDTTGIEGYLNMGTLSTATPKNGSLTSVTWAPDKEPGQNGKLVQGANRGTARLIFNGDPSNYLDIPVTIAADANHVTPTDPGVNPDNPDPQHSDLFMSVTRKVFVNGTQNPGLTQTIRYARDKYTDTDGNVISYGAWKIGKVESGHWVDTPTAAATFAQETAPSEAGKDTYVQYGDDASTKTKTDVINAENVKNRTDAQGYVTPQDGTPVYVTYQNTPATDVKVTYTFHDDTDNKTVGTPVVVAGNEGEILPTNLVIPNGYKLAEGQTLPTTVTIPRSDETVTIHLVHSTKTVTPGEPGVTPTDPSNPAYKDLFKSVTRTINVVNPITGETEQHDETVEFGRTGVWDEADSKFTSFGDWYVYNTSDNTLTDETTGTWEQFDAPEFSGYTPSQAVVEAKTVNAETPDETVTITYTKSDNGDHGNGGNTNPTPNPGDNGDHNNGENGNHGNQGNGNGNGANLNTNNGDNGNNAHNNGAAKKALPQTGNTNNAAAVAGLGLAGLTAMLGLAGTMKRKHN